MVKLGTQSQVAMTLHPPAQSIKKLFEIAVFQCKLAVYRNKIQNVKLDEAEKLHFRYIKLLFTLCWQHLE